MPVSLKYPTLVKNLGNTKKKQNKKQEKTKTISRLFGRGVPAKTLWKEAKTLEKTKKIQKTICLDSLEGGGSQPRLYDLFFMFFLFSKFFFGFGHFQPFAPFCTLAVRCLHVFKLAGTNRLTTAAMNILGLRIKTVCSNFEFFGNVLDNKLSFMLYFLKTCCILW